MDLGKLVGDDWNGYHRCGQGGADDNRQKLHVQLALHRQYILGWVNYRFGPSAAVVAKY